MIHIHCESCGDSLIEGSGSYKCPSCGRTYVADDLSSQTEKLKTLFGEMMLEQKEEQIANLRRELWKAIHEEYIDSVKIVGYCREIKKLLPDDFQAEFYDAANSGNAQNLNKFLDGTDTQKYAVYIPDIIEFMLKSLSSENLLAVNNLIERAYKQTDLLTYDKYTTMFAEEVAKVDECVYDVTVPRDVFVAYSSADMNKVSELVEVLESEGLSCFVAMRNLQHGRGAVANYERRLQEAIDNCKTVVLVSSVISRTRSDARKVELPYIRKRDMDRAPSEYSSDYGKMPAKYKKPRIEYLIEQYKGMAAESYVKEFFTGCEYRYSPKEVAEAIFELLAHPIEETSERDDELKRAIEEQRQALEDQQKMFEQMRNAQASTSNGSGVNVNSLLMRAKQFSENGDYASAKSYYNRVLDEQADNASAWWGLFFADHEIDEGQLKVGHAKANEFCNYASDRNYLNAVKYAYGEIKAHIENYTNNILKPICEAEKQKRIEEQRRLEEEKRLKEQRMLEEQKRRKKQDFLNNSDIRDNVLIKYSGKESDVTIPDNITSIEDMAFIECKILRSIYIPSSVTRIGYKAFKDCISLTNITISSGVTNIDKQAFYGCSNLTNITIPDGVTNIGENAFYGCRSLTNITIPDSVTNIGAQAFLGCNNLIDITIPNSVTNIGEYAFFGCHSFKDITIPDSVTNLGNNVFCGCDNLKNIAISNNVTSLIGTFQDCHSLRNITIPDSVTSIGEFTFFNCFSLTSITIPDSVTSIENNAFFGCSNLTDITIPNSVVSIGTGVFRDCDKLTNVTMPKKLAGFMNSNLKKLFGANYKKINFTFT